MLFLPACDSRTYVDWHYTIPNDYYGFLVVHYECQNGKPLVIQNGKIYLDLNDDGTACISDKFLPTSGKVFVNQSDGKPVRYVGAPWNENGYAFFTVGVQGIEQQGVDYGTFEIHWVGNIEKMAQKYSLEGLDEFLEARFGVPPG